ncbi:rpp14 family protein [Cystoisospora suis]|uniref:Rpp14 family protein n=1 Tax=Cystoisospora suis TaxID=483139 RepID=A0A2C6L9P3_9APIC|nr:rpp14 family protein [Cystoisospora suis]
MVRRKSRWIIGLLLWEEEEEKAEENHQQSESHKDKKATIDRLTSSTFQDVLKNAVGECWGAIGMAYLSSSLRVAYLGKGIGKSPLFVIQTEKAYCQELLAVLKAITQLGGSRCSISVLHVSGTLRSGVKFLSHHIHQMINTLSIHQDGCSAC